MIVRPMQDAPLPASQVIAHVQDSVLQLQRHLVCSPQEIPWLIAIGTVYRESGNASGDESANPSGSTSPQAPPDPHEQTDQGVLQLSIAAVDAASGRKTLWERITCESLTRGQAQALHEELRQRLPSSVELSADAQPCVDAPPLPDKPALWHYHPERMRHLTPFGHSIASCGVRHDGALTTGLQEEVQQLFEQADQQILAALPLRRRVAQTREFGRALDQFRESLTHYATFNGHGRQIFDIPPQMTAMFEHTDTDGIHWDDIELPYPCLYLHLGAQKGSHMGNGWLAEGLYLQDGADSSGARHLSIAVVSAPPSLQAYLEVDVTVPPTYIATLGPAHFAMPLAQAMEASLSERIERLHAEQHQEQSARQRRDEELSLLSVRGAVHAHMLHLAANALCYLSAYPKDIDTHWPTHTPVQHLEELWRVHEQHDERKKVLNRLAALECFPIHLCGRNLAAEFEPQEALRMAMDTLRLGHWDRGRWARQSDDSSTQKLLWHMPRLRPSHDTGATSTDEAPARIYLSNN